MSKRSKKPKKALEPTIVTPEQNAVPTGPGSRVIRLAVVLAGIIVGQAILFGPSFIGQKVLLPVDILAYPGVYIPTPAGSKLIAPRDLITADLVLQFEPERRFTAGELHAGR